MLTVLNVLYLHWYRHFVQCTIVIFEVNEVLVILHLFRYIACWCSRTHFLCVFFLWVFFFLGGGGFGGVKRHNCVALCELMIY